MHRLNNLNIILLVQGFGPFTTTELVEIVDYSRLNYKYLVVSQVNSKPYLNRALVTLSRCHTVTSKKPKILIMLKSHT
jgi:hypothetical protein